MALHAVFDKSYAKMNFELVLYFSGIVFNFCYDFMPINCARGSGFSTDYLQGLPVHHHARVQGRGGDGCSNLDEKENPGGRGRGGGGETEERIEGLKLRMHLL